MAEFAPDSPLEGAGFEFQYAGAVNLVVAPLFRRMLGTGSVRPLVFGQHDALHQSGVDPTAEAAIRAGHAQSRILIALGRKRQRSTGWTAPADPVLVHGNRLCGAKEPQPVPFIGWGPWFLRNLALRRLEIRSGR